MTNPQVLLKRYNYLILLPDFKLSASGRPTGVSSARASCPLFSLQGIDHPPIIAIILPTTLFLSIYASRMPRVRTGGDGTYAPPRSSTY